MTQENSVLAKAAEFCAVLDAAYLRWSEQTNCSGLLEPTVYSVKPGRKYLKITQARRGDEERGCSVHCFIDAKTGDIYKAASWNAPAKGVRYNLFTDFELLKTRADWSGGYLYAR